MGKSYKDLVAWQKAMDSVAEIYKLTRAFPKEEMYGLTSQNDCVIWNRNQLSHYCVTRPG
jgi:hypothetical protein